MAHARAKHPRLDLLVVAGPDEGLRLRLEPPGPVPIGRSAKGLTLGDPLVSIQHAELFWERGGWRVRDVGSATGTRVGGSAVEEGQSVAVRAGDVLEIGETAIRISRPQPVILPIVAAVALVLLAASGAAGLALVQGAARSSARALTWHEPIRQGAVQQGSRRRASPNDARLALSSPFLRQRGIDPGAMRIERVTDFDDDGIDEVWLAHGDEELVVTFAPDGAWRELGRTPLGCLDGSRPGDRLIARDFPIRRCPGRSYEFADGAYRVSEQEGAVVWVRERPAPGEGADAREPPPAERIAPYTVVARRPDKLAGFLAARGVSEPVAWVLCETASPALRPQVRTARGAVRPLAFGCHTDVAVEGQIDGEVVAVAFTAAGRDALLDDLRRFHAGNADGLFAPADQRARLDEWAAEPGYLKGGTFVGFEGAEHYFHPIAAEGALPPSADLLLPTSGAAPAPPALTATLLTSGVATLDPPGCASLELHTGSWSCSIASACVGGSTFLTVREVGCGEPRTVLTAPYAGGVFDGAAEGVEVRAVVDASSGADGTSVYQARVSYRLARP